MPGSRSFSRPAPRALSHPLGMMELKLHVEPTRRLLSKWCGSWRWGGFGVVGQRCGAGGGAGAGGGWGAWRWAGLLEGEGAVVVGDAEVGEAHEVDGCGSGGEPEVVGGDAAVGDASGLVAGEPCDGAFGRCF